MSPTGCRRDESMCQTTLAGGHDVYVSGRLARCALRLLAVGRRDAGTHPLLLLDHPALAGRATRSARCACSTSSRERSPSSSGARSDCSPAGRRRARTAAAHSRAASVPTPSSPARRTGSRRSRARSATTSRRRSPRSSASPSCSCDMDDIAERPDDQCLRRPVQFGGQADARDDRRPARLCPGRRLAGSRPNPIEPLVAEVVADLGPAVRRRHGEGHGADIIADPSQLRALLQNLIGNAVTYRGDRPRGRGDQRSGRRRRDPPRGRQRAASRPKPRGRVAPARAAAQGDPRSGWGWPCAYASLPRTAARFVSTALPAAARPRS